jgi:hypothetical protein
MPFRVPRWTTKEARAGNPGQLLLIVLALVIYVIRFRQLKPIAHIVVATLFTQFFLYNLLLTWQPFATRLHLPGFVLWSPFVAVIFSEIRRRYITYFAILGLVILASYPLFFNENRRLVPPNTIFQLDRSIQYSATDRQRASDIIEVVDALIARECYTVALQAQPNALEYLIWGIWQTRTEIPLHLEWVNVDNAHEALPRNSQGFSPCAVIAIENGWGAQTILVDEEIFYSWQVWDSMKTAVFFKAENP